MNRWAWLIVASGAALAVGAVIATRARHDRARLTEVLKIIPDCLSLLRDILRDPAVPRRAKLAPAVALFYLAIPIDLVPDFIPGLGQLDDALVAAWALRRLVAGAGRERVTGHWQGRPDTLDRLLRLARAE